MHFSLDLKSGRTSSGDPAFHKAPEDRRTIQVVNFGFLAELGKKIVSKVAIATHIIIYAIAKAIMLVGKIGKLRN
jgi:hypothetical protein